MGHCCKFSWLPLLKYSGLPQVQQNTFAVITSIGLFLKAIAVPQENGKKRPQPITNLTEAQH